MRGNGPFVTGSRPRRSGSVMKRRHSPPMTFLRDPQSRRSTSVCVYGDRGATAVEYALLVSGIAIVMIVGVAILGSNLNAGMASAAGAMSGSASTAGATDQDQDQAEAAEAARVAAEQEAAAAEAARVAAEQEAARVAAEQEAAAAEAARVAAEQEAAASATVNCTGKGVATGRDAVSPTCTKGGTWTCPRDYDLEKVGKGRGASAVYTCKSDD